MTEIIHGIWRKISRLSGPHNPVSSYVVSTNTGIVVIDPALDFSPQDLRALRIKATDVVLTHVHAENCSGAHAFAGSASCWAARGDVYLTYGRRAVEKLCTRWVPPWDWSSLGNYQGHLAGALNERPLEKPLPGVKPLAPGRRIRGIRWMATPGHGKNAVTYLYEAAGKRVAFCGDLIFGNGQVWNWYDLEWDYGAETGVKALLDSARKLLAWQPDMLLPTHGPVVRGACGALTRLIRRLERILKHRASAQSRPINFPEVNAPVNGFRQVAPRLYQWRTGNCAVLVSRSGHALCIDAGLCNWVPLKQRKSDFRNVIAELKARLRISRIEIVIPTHYHGDHTENIPALIETDSSEVVCLKSICGPMERPDNYNLAAKLPWYGTAHDRITIDRKLRNRQKFSWREYTLELFHLGGQTVHHLGVSLQLGRQRVLFVGDAIHNQLPLTPGVICYNDAEPATRGWAYAVDRMAERRPDLLVCGHGSAIRNPLPRLRRMQQAWRARLKVYAALNPRRSNLLFFTPPGC